VRGGSACAGVQCVLWQHESVIERGLGQKPPGDTGEGKQAQSKPALCLKKSGEASDTRWWEARGRPTGRADGRPR